MYIIILRILIVFYVNVQTLHEIFYVKQTFFKSVCIKMTLHNKLGMIKIQ